MPRPSEAGATGPPRRLVRRVVSALIVFHLFAIGVAVTSFSSPGFPAPALAVRASAAIQPYLQATFLNNAYRFFAPNPGTPTVFWFRIQYGDRSIRWVELPGRGERWWRARYQRRLNLAVQLGQQLAFVSHPDESKQLAPIGRHLLESAVRHVARAYPRTSPTGEFLGVESIGVYCVFHGTITPAQVRQGWVPTDLRTYRPTFVGAYSAAGERVDEFDPAVVEQPIAYVAAGVLDVDVLPAVRAQPHGDAAAVVDALRLPEPLGQFLRRHPELLRMTPGEDLEQRVASVLDGQTGDR